MASLKVCEEGSHLVERLFWSKQKNRKSACMSCAKKYGVRISSNVKQIDRSVNLAVKRKKIANVSDKQKDRLAKYRVLRDEYFKTHNICEAKLERCTKIATDLHHKKSRIGDNLFKHFSALCRNCHNSIENGGQWVYDLGFKIKRTEI